MDKELKDILESLNGNVQQLNKSAGVKVAASTAVPPATGGDNPEAGGAEEIESKGIRSKDLDEKFVDPLRKNLEALAKASPSNFGILGSTKVLDDPYSFLREKNADGTHKISLATLDMMARGIAAINSTREKAVAAGAVEFDEWCAKSGNPNATIQSRLDQAAEQGQFGSVHGETIRRTIDTGSGAPLIRQDLEPILRETFNRYFPAYEMLPKIPANSVKHTWTQKTAPGSASLISELGSLVGTASDSTYARALSTNIAVMASYRSIGLKAQFASQQSGMNFNLGGSENNEVTSAMQAIALLVQSLIFQGNESTAAKTVDDEEGAYNVLGFDGLRTQLKGAGYSITKASETYIQILRKAVGQLYDAGADLNSILMFLSVGAMNAVDDELQDYLRINKNEVGGGAVPTALGRAGLAMLNGILSRPQMVPAQGQQTSGIGYYTYSAAATEDIYLLDPNGTALPYLGSPSPTVIQLPLGTSDKLAQVYIPFFMVGLAIYVKNFNRKVRIPQQVL